MSKKATKAADNMYCIARYEASKTNDTFSSREKASELLHIERTRLSNIELGNIKPYPDEVITMAKAYNAPELCNAYCACECSIGVNSVKRVEIEDFDRLALKVLGSLKDIEQLRSSLIEISEDGVITKNEKKEFDMILDSLDKISTNAKALQLWAEKNIRCE